MEPPAATSKRKRNVPVEIESDEEEVKPVSRTRRSGSTQHISNGKTSLRAKKSSLGEVREEDEDEASALPPRKKSRSSQETEVEAEEGDVLEDAPKTRTRKPASRTSAGTALASTTRKTRGSSVKPEVAETPLPRRKTVAPTKTARSTRRISTIVIDTDNEEGYELGEHGEKQDIKPPAATRGKRGVKKEIVEDKEVYVIGDSDDEPPVPRRRKTPAASKPEVKDKKTSHVSALQILRERLR